MDAPEDHGPGAMATGCVECRVLLWVMDLACWCPGACVYSYRGSLALPTLPTSSCGVCGHLGGELKGIPSLELVESPPPGAHGVTAPPPQISQGLPRAHGAPSSWGSQGPLSLEFMGSPPPGAHWALSP